MKELENKDQDKELAIVAQHNTLKLIGQQQFISGLPLWQLNVKTKVIEPAKIIGKKVTIKERGRFQPGYVPFNEKEVVYDVESNPDLVFIQAINRKNAARKFGKAGL